jgi:hypothetical protein
MTHAITHFVFEHSIELNYKIGQCQSLFYVFFRQHACPLFFMIYSIIQPSLILQCVLSYRCANPALGTSPHTQDSPDNNQVISRLVLTGGVLDR